MYKRQVHACVLQPEDHAAWQTLKFLEEGEISDVAMPGNVVELGGGAISKARKGQISMKPRSTASGQAEKFQRGPDLYSKLYAEFQHLSASYGRDEGTIRPILLIDMSHGVADSALALLDRAVAAAAQRRSAGGSAQVSSTADPVHGLFADPKDSNRVVGKARRDAHIKGLYLEGKFKADGFDPVSKPADIKSMEEECGKPLPVGFSVLASVEREGKHFLTFPEAEALKVNLKGTLRKKYDDLRKDFPPPPPPKRICLSGTSTVVTPNKCFSMQQILEKFILLKNEPITIGGQEFKIFRGQSKVCLLYTSPSPRD